MHVSSRMMRKWLALAALGGMAACDKAEHEFSFTQQAIRCGVERWPVKTGTDDDVDQVILEPLDIAIADLVSFPRPPGTLPQRNRVSDAEFQVWRLTDITLTDYKLETGDSDYHLVLSDGFQTLIAEIPHPDCVGPGSPFLPGLQTARDTFDSRYTATPFFQTANVTATFIGAGFFDFFHGQRGVAPNGIELHSVVGLCFDPGCKILPPPFPTPQLTR